MRSDSPSESNRRDRIAVRVSNRDYPSIPGSVHFSAGAIRGSGTILDISATGAHVYRPTKTVPRGIVVDLFFLQPKTERRLYAEGEVVRMTETGFVVRFRRVERELESLVLAAASGEAESES
jgi:hypothetical protein